MSPSPYSERGIAMNKKLILIGSLVSILIINLGFIGISQATTINGLCITEVEFADFNAMTEGQIREFLADPKKAGGFLKDPFLDVDGVTTVDAAQEIFKAAQVNKINPRVLLTTLEKEKGGVRRVKTLPPDPVVRDRLLRRLAGWDPADLITLLNQKSAKKQIQEMAAQFARDYYTRLSQCQNTPRGWDVDVGRLAGDEPGDERDPAFNNILVTPESKAVASLYAYTGWVGQALGGGSRALRPKETVGGNGVFCELWSQFGFARPAGPLALALSPPSPTLTCAAETSRCVSLNASGDPGPNGYSWSITGPNLSTTEGVLTVTGVNKQNVQLKPPTNTGSGVAGVAYDKHGSVFTTGCVEFTNCSQRVDYGCNNQVLGAPNPAGHGPHPGAPIGLCAGVVFGSPQCLPLCNCVPCDCGNGSFDAANRFGASFDLRTQEMIDAGCRPCVVEMQGVTVTVTDAAGASATNTVKAQ